MVAWTVFWFMLRSIWKVQARSSGLIKDRRSPKAMVETQWSQRAARVVARWDHGSKAGDNDNDTEFT